MMSKHKQVVLYNLCVGLYVFCLVGAKAEEMDEVYFLVRGCVSLLEYSLALDSPEYLFHLSI
jgi:hypothetical protein